MEDAAGGEEESGEKPGDGEEQQEVGAPGEQGDEKDGNLPIDNTDQGSKAGESGDAAGGEQELDRQEGGSSTGALSGPGGTPEEISGTEAAASQAVERFDQMGDGPGEADPESLQTGLPDENAIPGAGVSMIMMEQWLEQIEGDPAYLLRNQFLIEERQELERRGRELMETRPW
jgi:Ca-activated chloride channel family protein